MPNKLILSAKGDSLTTRGVFTADICRENKYLKSNIYVSNNLRENLLERKDAEKLGLVIKGDLLSIGNKYLSLFEGIRNLANEYHIILQKNAEPFAIVAPRKVPIQLKNAAKSKWKN